MSKEKIPESKKHENLRAIESFLNASLLCEKFNEGETAKEYKVKLAIDLNLMPLGIFVQSSDPEILAQEQAEFEKETKPNIILA